ncbi:MAG: choice-of-anchor J domain-containing protein [Bacteroidales bacterium]|nr:choice-of-anchor J domain-containing protein [Bacteroidales bacterium]
MKHYFYWTLAVLTTISVTIITSCDKPENNPEDESSIIVDPTETGDSILLHANFDNAIPATWKNLDQDGDGNKWLLFSDVFGHDFMNGYCNTDCAISSSKNELHPDNWLISPQFHIPGSGGYKLQFYIGSLDANRFEENYSVYVGKIKNGVFEQQGTLGTGTTQGSFLQYIEYSLEAYKGHDICIAFRHHNTTEMSFLLLDEVQISLAE